MILEVPIGASSCATGRLDSRPAFGHSNAQIQERPITLNPRTWPRKILDGAAITFMVPTFASLSFDESPFGAVLGIVLLILSLGVHEAAHAWSAYKLGDPTAKDLGRMTINPIVHIDLWMTIGLPLLCAISGAPMFGGAKPVPVNFHRLRNPWVDMAVVAFAGPLSNFLLAMLFLALSKFFVLTGYYNGAADVIRDRSSDMLPAVLKAASEANVILFAFNLIPIPPLDGSRIMVNVLPESLRENYLRIGAFGLFAIYYLINFVAAFNDMFWGMSDAINGIVRKLVSAGGVW